MIRASLSVLVAALLGAGGVFAYLLLEGDREALSEIGSLASRMRMLESRVAGLREEGASWEVALGRLAASQSRVRADVVEIGAKIDTQDAGGRVAVGAGSGASELVTSAGHRIDPAAEIEEIIDWLERLNTKVEEMEDAPRVVFDLSNGVVPDQLQVSGGFTSFEQVWSSLGSTGLRQLTTEELTIDLSELVLNEDPRAASGQIGIEVVETALDAATPITREFHPGALDGLPDPGTVMTEAPE